MLRIHLILSLFFLFLINAQAQQVKIEDAVYDAFGSSKIVEYIVYMRDRADFSQGVPFQKKSDKANFVYRTLVQKAEKSQKEIIDYLKANNIFFQSFYVTNAILIRSDIQTFLWISKREEAEWIFYNQPIKLLQYEAEKETALPREVEPEWGLKMIQADSVWKMGIRGKNVVIGGQDTGFSWEVSPLKNKYRGYVDSTTAEHRYNWYDAIHESNPNYPDSLLNPCGFNSLVPCDDNNHGTHTMGTMVGEDEENKIGVAPEAQWIACRNMDRGWGKPSTYLECFEWFLAPFDENKQNPDPSKAPHVINNSWYCSEEEGCNLSNFYLMRDAVKNLKASGVVVVVSAGNSGSNCSTVTGPPAIFAESFSVGATNQSDTIAGFSSRGLVTIDSSFVMKPNVSAPGARVRSVLRNGEFANFSGTSMAGPHVAGLVALIISANPFLEGQVELIEEIIMSTADPKTTDQDCNDVSGMSVPNPVYGFGRINALAAVLKAQSYVSNTSDEIKPALKVFPNPVTEEVTFSLGNDGIITLLTLYNAEGRLLYQTINELENRIITIKTDLHYTGMCFYKVTDKSGASYFGKIIKQ